MFTGKKKEIGMTLDELELKQNKNIFDLLEAEVDSLDKM